MNINNRDALYFNVLHKIYEVLRLACQNQMERTIRHVSGSSIRLKRDRLLVKKKQSVIVRELKPLRTQLIIQLIID